MTTTLQMRPQTVHAARAPRAKEPPGPGVKILVVDDIEANLVAMKALLAQPGVEVLAAGSGAQALEMLLQHDLALALLDVQMPGMDGYSLAELMRGSERTRGVPIIFLTAGAQQAHESFRGYESGAVDFLYKPIDERILRSKVQVFVELHRQRRTIAEHAAQLARLSHANALMLAALSHDIREPLAALALAGKLLAERSESTALRQVAERHKAATALLRRQVDHLINLAKAPSLELRPACRASDLGRIADRCWAAHDELAPPGARGRLDIGGDPVGHWDTELLTAAVDHLLLQALTHSGGAPIELEIDGHSRALVSLRIRFAKTLSDAAALHLLGSGAGADGLPPPVGEGLRAAERVARAHGGSLLGRSRAGEGTSFELLLPRGVVAG